MSQKSSWLPAAQRCSGLCSKPSLWSRTSSSPQVCSLLHSKEPVCEGPISGEKGGGGNQQVGLGGDGEMRKGQTPKGKSLSATSPVQAAGTLEGKEPQGTHGPGKGAQLPTLPAMLMPLAFPSPSSLALGASPPSSPSVGSPSSLSAPPQLPTPHVQPQATEPSEAADRGDKKAETEEATARPRGQCVSRQGWR